MCYLRFIAGLFLVFCVYGFSAEETFLLIDGKTSEVVLEVGRGVNERMSPCSSFKIALSLMGYDAGILKDENIPIWDFQEGYDDLLEFWKAPQAPESWMKYSCVWYSKLLALQLGEETIQSYLTSMEYGNKDIAGGLGRPGPESVAWINSSLEISPKEQVYFIQKMIQGKLPVSTSAMAVTKVILFKEELAKGWKLFGKTGWSGSDVGGDGEGFEHSWFVGWIEKDQGFYPFAYLIREKKIRLEARIPRVKHLLLESGVIKD